MGVRGSLGGRVRLESSHKYVDEEGDSNNNKAQQVILP